MDANEYALNKHMSEVEKCEKAQAEFDMDIKDYLDGMDIFYNEIKKLANDYSGYDMSDYAKEEVKQKLGV